MGFSYESRYSHVDEGKEKYSDLEGKFNILKTEKAEKLNSESLKPIETEITHIKHKANINMRMQDQDRRNNLVIVGIEEKISETQDDLDKNMFERQL